MGTLIADCARRNAEISGIGVGRAQGRDEQIENTFPYAVVMQ
jgi:hypothetical protein